MQTYLTNVVNKKILLIDITISATAVATSTEQQKTKTAKNSVHSVLSPNTLENLVMAKKIANAIAQIQCQIYNKENPVMINVLTNSNSLKNVTQK